MLLETTLWAALSIFIFMNLFYFISIWQKNAGVVDIAWGLGFVVVAWSFVLSTPVLTSPQIAVTGLVTIWGTRLAWHLGKRNIGKSEDWRYRQRRNDWGQTYLWHSYLQIFMLQGFLMLIICASTIVAFASSAEVMLGWQFYLGMAVWGAGFIIETIADSQLNQFLIAKKSNKVKAKFLTTGLWRYSRHPNYFGEATQWWGIWLLVIQLPYGSLAVISPATITFLVVSVSGVPILEKKFSKDKSWRAYAAKTSKFIPLPPKS